MTVNNVYYSDKLVKEFQKLPLEIIKLAIKKEEIFKNNPIHFSLRLRELHSVFREIWTISLSNNYKIF